MLAHQAGLGPPAANVGDGERLAGQQRQGRGIPQHLPAAFAFGAVVFRDVPREHRDAELRRLSTLRPSLTKHLDCEELVVREVAGAVSAMQGGVLTVDRLTPARAGIVALTVAQSAAMEYYERVIEQLFERTRAEVARLEQRGTMSLSTRRLHRFMAEAVSTRTDVISVLHLLIASWRRRSARART